MALSAHLCRLPLTRTDLALPDYLTRIRCRKPFSVRCSGDSSSVAVDSDFDAKVFRKNLTRSKNYNRKGFGHKEETLQLMNREYTRTATILNGMMKMFFMKGFNGVRPKKEECEALEDC